MNTISLSSLPHHPVLSTFASTNVVTGVQEAVGYTNSKETRGAKVGDRRWCFRTGYMEGDKLAIVGAGKDSKASSKKSVPGTPVFHFETKGMESSINQDNEESVNENTPLSISMDIEYGGTRRTSVQEEILEALNSPLKFTGAEVAPLVTPDEEGGEVVDERVIKGITTREGERVMAIEKYERDEERTKDKLGVVGRFVGSEGSCKTFLKGLLLAAWGIVGAGCVVGVTMQAIDEKETFPQWFVDAVLGSPEVTTLYVGISAWILGSSLGWGGLRGVVGVLSVVGIAFAFIA
jgi:hypothetical protein